MQGRRRIGRPGTTRRYDALGAHHSGETVGSGGGCAALRRSGRGGVPTERLDWGRVCGFPTERLDWSRVCGFPAQRPGGRASVCSRRNGRAGDRLCGFPAQRPEPRPDIQLSRGRGPGRGGGFPAEHLDRGRVYGSRRTSRAGGRMYGSRRTSRAGGRMYGFPAQRPGGRVLSPGRGPGVRLSPERPDPGPDSQLSRRTERGGGRLSSGAAGLGPGVRLSPDRPGRGPDVRLSGAAGGRTGSRVCALAGTAGPEAGCAAAAGVEVWEIAPGGTPGPGKVSPPTRWPGSRPGSSLPHPMAWIPPRGPHVATRFTDPGPARHTPIANRPAPPTSPGPRTPRHPNRTSTPNRRNKNRNRAPPPGRRPIPSPHPTR
ncbi:hypothetical protein M2160_006089 [Streptomyces sp. SAI-117]|nr:hypothetical protein [Streptomyces sp. SAI-117]